MKGFNKLYTQEGENLHGIPWDVYPRPSLARKEWLNLNGVWELETGSGRWSILVPFCPESLLSGFEGEVRCGETLIYKRSFTLPPEWAGRRILLHFGAVSRECTVYVNGDYVISHSNAYTTFTADITDRITAGENEIEVKAVNDLDPRFPHGKQRVDRGGMWYTPSSGIWQTVWLEPVPEKHIQSIGYTVKNNSVTIGVFGIAEGVVECVGKTYPLIENLTDEDDGYLEPGHCGDECECRIVLDSPRFWSPEDPFLYEFTVKSGEDEVTSYFALRTVSKAVVNGVPRLLLNGKPYFFHGLLDQGYFSDGLYTPASPALYEQDILRMKSLGFNTLRKHIKIEPELFYYFCDKLGMAVFQDMVNNGRYSFMRDTLLPTLGIQRLNDRHINRSRAARVEFMSAMRSTVLLLSGHPCICCWTIFNEGWGQFDADSAYKELIEMDSTRMIDSTSGWFHQKKSDVDSLHIYFKKLRLGNEREKPQVLSEFGGFVYKIREHSFNTKKTYGYKLLKTREQFVSELRRIYLEEVIPLAQMGLCGSIYTQVSDVEDETNGLLTYDRRVMKLLPEEFNDISAMLASAVKNTCE